MDNTQQPDKAAGTGTGAEAGAAKTDQQKPPEQKPPVRKKKLYRPAAIPRVNYLGWVTGIKWNRVATIYLISVPVAAIVFWTVWLRHQRTEERQIPILMYHQVGTNKTDSPWIVMPDDFRSQLSRLRREGYTSVLPADLAANWKWGKPLPIKPIIITFDDGHRDSLKLAESILKQYEFEGIAYLITSLVSEDEAKPCLFEETPCITWPEVRKMQRRGVIAFGGHGHEHKNLAAEADPSPLIVECMKQLKKHGVGADSFCYPYGQYKPATSEAVKKAGFTTAVACEDKFARTGGAATDFFSLPRISVMGGKHEFAVTRLEGPQNVSEMAFKVKHTGIPLEVTPVIKSIRGNVDWLAVREMAADEIEVKWSKRDPAVIKAAYTLDIWDKHRLFPLYMTKIVINLPAEQPPPEQPQP